MTKHVEQILTAGKETHDQHGEVEQAFSELQDLKKKNFELERVVKECLVFANVLQNSPSIKSLDMRDAGLDLESILKNIEDFWNKQSL